MICLTLVTATASRGMSASVSAVLSVSVLAAVRAVLSNSGLEAVSAALNFNLMILDILTENGAALNQFKRS